MPALSLSLSFFSLSLSLSFSLSLLSLFFSLSLFSLSIYGYTGFARALGLTGRRAQVAMGSVSRKWQRVWDCGWRVSQCTRPHFHYSKHGPSWQAESTFTRIANAHPSPSGPHKLLSLLPPFPSLPNGSTCAIISIGLC